MIIKIFHQSSRLLIFFKRTHKNWPGVLVTYGISACRHEYHYTIQRSEYEINWDKNRFYERVFPLWMEAERE